MFDDDGRFGGRDAAADEAGRRGDASKVEGGKGDGENGQRWVLIVMQWGLTKGLLGSNLVVFGSGSVRVAASGVV